MEDKVNKATSEEEIKAIAHIFFDFESIYDAYAHITAEHNDFTAGAKSFVQFIQKLAKAGFEEKDIDRFNGISNFCTSFLIKNNLLSEEEIENITKGDKE